MYKLFLTFRYLTRKKIVIFPILVVWLCVMMMIIVTSIMGGFVEHVRQANRDLLGDIIISNRNPAGWARYQELQDYLKGKFPEIEASTATVQAFGLVTAHTNTFGVQIVGIDPVGRAKVSKFGETLYEQHIGPMNAVEDLSGALPATGDELQKYAVKLQDQAYSRWQKAEDADTYQEKLAMGAIPRPKIPALNYQALWGLVVVAGLIFWMMRKRMTGWRWAGVTTLGVVGLAAIGVLVAWPMIFPLALQNADDAEGQATLELTRANRTVRFAATLPGGQKFSTREDLIKVLVPAVPSFAVPGAPAATGAASEDAEQGCIAGSYVIYGQRDA